MNYARTWTHWRPEEDDLLRRLWADATLMRPDIDRRMHPRTPSAVGERAARLGLKRRVGPKTQSSTTSASWIKGREAMFEALCATGMSAREIAAKMGNGATRNAVIGKRRRLGIETVIGAPAAPQPEPKPIPVASTAFHKPGTRCVSCHDHLAVGVNGLCQPCNRSRLSRAKPAEEAAPRRPVVRHANGVSPIYSYGK